MKLPIIILAIVLTAILAGTLQHRELSQLRAQTKTLLEAVETTPKKEIPNQPSAVAAPGARSKIQALEAVTEDDTHLSESDKIRRKAADFIREAEEVVSRGSKAEATVKLTPKLLFASPALLKEVLAQLNASTLAEPPKQLAWKVILQQLAKKEPADAMRIALHESGRSAILFPDVFQYWIDKNPAAAEAWYAENKTRGDIPPELMSRAELSMFGALADRDLDKAIGVLEAEEPDSRDAMLGRLRESLTDLGKWNQVADRAVHSEDPALKNGLILALSNRVFAFGSTEEQLDRIAQLGLEGGELAPFAFTALRSAARSKNPAELAEWGLARLPQRDLKWEVEVKSLVYRWSQTDRAGVEAWVENLPPGDTKNAGSQHLEALSGRKTGQR